MIETNVVDSQANAIPQPAPYFGMFVHCLTGHHGQSVTFTSERKSPGNRPKLVIKIGRSPWVVEVVELLHPQSNQNQFWTLPTTASFQCNCLKLEHPEKIGWWYLYQCMGRIRQDLYRDPYRIQNAYEIGALEIDGDKWKPSQTYFQKHAHFRPVDSVASLKQTLMQDFLNDLKNVHSPVFTKYSTIIFQALEVLVSTLLLHSEVWALVETVDLVIDDKQHVQHLVAVAARLIPMEFTQEPTVPFAEYICFAHNTNIWSAAASLFHGYIRPSSTDPLDETWIPAVTFFCRGLTVPRPVMTKSTLISVLKKAQKYANCTTDRPTCLVGMSYSRQQHVTNIAGGVIGENACTHYFDSVHGRDKRWGVRSYLSTVSHLACLIPSL